MLRFKIELSERTATIVEELKDFAPLTSACCGSARKLPSRGWLVDWGGPGNWWARTRNEHLRISKLTFSRFTYRAVPILPGGINTDTLRAGMGRPVPPRRERAVGRLRSGASAMGGARLERATSCL